MPAVIPARSTIATSGFICLSLRRRALDFTRSETAVPAPQVEKFGKHYKTAYLKADMPVSVDHGIIGLMDPAHGPFVHQAWWWRCSAQHPRKEKRFRTDFQWFSHERAYAQLEQCALQVAADVLRMRTRSRPRLILFCRICGRRRFGLVNIGSRVSRL